jgi:hypothetical protein
MPCGSVPRAAHRAANAAPGTVEQAHTTTDRVIALIGAYSDALNHIAPMVRRLADPVVYPRISTKERADEHS